MALRKAGLEPGDIDYVNAHGTSTMADTIELGAVRACSAMPVHRLDEQHQVRHRPPAGRRGRGRDDLLHPGDPRSDRAAHAQPRQSGAKAPKASTWCRTSAKKRTVRAALNNSFGFGGTNASLVVKAIDY
jgi:3-oxoacyl-[acyl-carrier-protein] synthase II